ncbi:MAG: P1 family peptidase [Ardenticatenaceae bacterium]|nr:P1 family peptidase [Ardenticatenaceae bacterium]
MLIPGLKIGHATNEPFHTGCTVFLLPEGCVGSVDVRGPAPGTRESALLAPDKAVQTINAILLTGGSAFGLAAADGVMRYLAEKGIGHPTPIKPIPIVPTAVVYDLFMNGGQGLPDADLGYEACQNAVDTAVPQGSVGAGAGVTVGKWSSPFGIMKSGFGLASWQEGDLIVMAGAVVNAIGDVVNEDGSVLAGARQEDGSWAADHDPLRRFPNPPTTPVGTNTTLLVVVTNARMTKVEAHRLAQRVHDGMAIAIRPVHTTHDGDTAFAVAANQVDANFDLVANTAVTVTAEAIRHAVREAVSVGPIPGLKQE